MEPESKPISVNCPPGSQSAEERQESINGNVKTEAGTSGHVELNVRPSKGEEAVVNQMQSSVQEISNTQRDGILSNQSTDSLMAEIRDRMKGDEFDMLTDSLAPRYYVGGEKIDIGKMATDPPTDKGIDTCTQSSNTFHSNGIFNRANESPKFSEVVTEIPIRKTCGHNWLVSLRTSITVQFTLLSFFSLFFLTLYSGLSNRTLLRQTQDTCSATRVEVLNAGIQTIENVTKVVAIVYVSNFAQNMSRFALGETKQSVGNLFIYLSSQQFLSPNFETELEPLFNATSFFMVKELQSFYQNVPLLYFTDINGNQRGYSFVRSYVERIGGSSVIPPTVFTAVGFPNVETGIPLSTIQLCNANLDTGEPISSMCLPEVSVNLTTLEFFELQSQYAGLPVSSVGLWTDFYPIGHFENFEAINSTFLGISYTWPLNFCGDYLCFGGVVSADLTSYSISSAATTDFNELIENIDTEDFFNASMENPLVLSSSCFYVVVRENSISGTPSQSGNLIGGTVVNESTSPLNVSGTPIDITRMENATESEFASIRNSSRFLTRKFGWFDEPIYNKELYTAFDIFTGEECRCTQMVTVDTFFDISSIVSSTCVTISTSPIQDTSIRLFPVNNTVSWVAISVLPCRLFTQEFSQQLVEVQEVVLEENERLEKQISTITLGSSLLSIFFIVMIVFLAIYISYHVSKPLRRLSKLMRKLRLLNFEETEKISPSRIKEVHNMQQTFVALKRALETFSKFVPTTVVRNIVHGGDNARRVHVRNRIVTTMFSDIAGFTSIAEKLPINELLYILTTYLTVMTKIVENFHGVVAEILGDGLLVFWNTPDDVQDHASKALATALACQRALHKSLNGKFEEVLTRYGLGPLSIRIGIHTGRVLSGNIGSDHKMKFGCMGDPVNLASRLEGLCKLYGVEIICSEDTVKLLPSRDTFLLRELDLVRVKGKSEPTKLFHVIRQDIDVEAMTSIDVSQYSNLEEGDGKKNGSVVKKFRSMKSNLLKKGKTPSPEQSTQKIQTRVVFFVEDENVDVSYRERVQQYEEALHAFQKGDFDDALKKINEICPSDKATDYLKQRIEDAQKKKPQEGEEQLPWDGVNNLMGKDF